MWFMNKIANPLMRLILRSPLHGILGLPLLLITYRGCKSGKEYSLPVQYAQDEHTIYIVPGTPEKKTWWRNLRGGAPVKLRYSRPPFANEIELIVSNYPPGWPCGGPGQRPPQRSGHNGGPYPASCGQARPAR